MFDVPPIWNVLCATFTDATPTQCKPTTKPERGNANQPVHCHILQLKAPSLCHLHMPSLTMTQGKRSVHKIPSYWDTTTPTTQRCKCEASFPYSSFASGSDSEAFVDQANNIINDDGWTPPKPWPLCTDGDIWPHFQLSD